MKILCLFILLSSFGVFGQYRKGLLSANSLPEFQTYKNRHGDMILKMTIQNPEQKVYGLRLPHREEITAPVNSDMVLSLQIHDGKQGYWRRTYGLNGKANRLPGFIHRTSQEFNLTKILQQLYQKRKMVNEDGVFHSSDSIDKVRFMFSENKAYLVDVKKPHPGRFHRVRFENGNDLKFVTQWFGSMLRENARDFQDIKRIMERYFSHTLHINDEDIYEIMTSSTKSLETKLKELFYNCNRLML